MEDHNLDNLKLNKMQQAAYDKIMTGKSILLTGEAGTGKSVVIQKFMNDQVVKIKELFEIRQKNNYEFKISVDGGVDDITGKECINNGVDILAVGSYILSKDKSEYKKFINFLK